MRSDKKTKKSKGAGLAKGLYVIAAVLAVIFVYMLVVNIMYITSYGTSYGMVFADMWQEAVQYVVTGSISYLVYAVLVFSAGKIMMMLSARPTCEKKPDIKPEPEAETVEDATDATQEFAQLILSEIYLMKQETEATTQVRVQEEKTEASRPKKQYKKRRTI